MELTTLVAEVLGVPVDVVDDSARPGELDNWDSLRHVNLIMRLEEHYGISFDYTELHRLTSLGALRTVLREKGALSENGGARNAGTAPGSVSGSAPVGASARGKQRRSGHDG